MDITVIIGAIVGGIATLGAVYVSISTALDVRRMKSAETRRMQIETDATGLQSALTALSTLRDQVKQYGADVIALHTQVNELVQDKARLQAAVTERDEHMESMEIDWERERSKFKEEINGLKSAAEKARTTIIGLQGQIDSLRALVIRLGGKLDELNQLEPG